MYNVTIYACIFPLAYEKVNWKFAYPYVKYAYLYGPNSSFRPGRYDSLLADVDDLKERETKNGQPNHYRELI